jgi:hypothetical protein
VVEESQLTSRKAASEWRHAETAALEEGRYVTAMTDYDPFRRASPEPKPREELLVWAFVKDIRTFTGSLRAVDDNHWEAVYLIDGALYKTQVFATRVLAEHDLMRTKDALEATGWLPKTDIEKGGGA